MKVAFLKPPSRGSFRGINFYAERLLTQLKKIPSLEISSVPYSPCVSYSSFDLVHSPFFEPYFFSLPLLARPKVLVTIHDATRLVFPDKFPAGMRGKTEWAAQKLLLPGKVAWVITDSQTSKNDIVRLFPWPENKITPIYLAADPAFKKLSKVDKSVAQKYSLPERFLLYVGGANWNKNVLNLCAAAEKVNTPLVIVGKEWTNFNIDSANIETEPLRQVRKFTNNKAPFVFTGFVPTEDLVCLYNLAAVYVQPSIYEGFGLPLLEAMSCAAPVVCGQNSSLSEIAGVAATFADVQSVRDLSLKILKLLKLPKAETEQLRKKSLAQAARFTWEKTAQQTYEIYSQVLAGN